MKKLTIMSFIFIIFLVGCLLYIGYSVKSQNKPYKSFESDLIEIAKTYIMTNQLNISVSSEHELTIDKMMEDKMLLSNKVKEDECTGSIIIKRTMSGYDYKPNIKCKNYESIKK